MVEKESRENPPIQVVPREDGWAVTREGNKKVSTVHPTRHQAEQHARSLARQSRTDFYLYDKQGRILAHDFYGPPQGPHGGEGAYGEEMGQVTLTRADTGAVQRQVAYYDREKDTWTVEVHTYPALDQSIPGLKEDPMGQAPTESDTYEEPSLDEVQSLYPELAEKVKTKKRQHHRSVFRAGEICSEGLPFFPLHNPSLSSAAQRRNTSLRGYTHCDYQGASTRSGYHVRLEGNFYPKLLVSKERKRACSTESS